MSSLWVKFKTNNAVKVSTEGCQDVDDFLKSCKKELSSKLGSYDVDQLFLQTTAGGSPLQPDDSITQITGNNAKNPLFILSSAINAVEELVVSMSYGTANMPFISEATGVEDYEQVWENIPVDDSIVPSEEFVELFKKNCSVFEFGAEASRRTLIDLFLREVVSQFPDFMIICEYHMTLLNKKKRKRLNGNCDYTICHRGHRNLPHLIAIEAKVTNKETMLQCIGECASIHYRRMQTGMQNKCVYGIHSTGSIWKLVFIDENGQLLVSKEYHL